MADAGAYRNYIKDVDLIELDDIQNPFTLFTLLFSEKKFIDWLVKNSLLQDKKKCDKCDTEVTLQIRSRAIDNYAF